MAAPSQLVGHILGHYRILEQIGAGGMGVVYRAHDERLDREVALKVLSPRVLADKLARKRFRKEALALSRLNHPNIETVYDFDSEGGVDFLVMEYLPGLSLDEKLAAGPLPEKETVRLGLQLTEGLAAAHQRGVLHRDLKPGNLRVSSDGRLKIVDFGLGKLLHSVSATASTASLSETRAGVGTLPYMAPEQMLGEKTDVRADIYALGSVLYEMAAGRRPFPERQTSRLMDAILHQTPVPPRVVNTVVSQELERIILKCLEKDPENRYQSTKDLAVDLRRLASSSTPGVWAAARSKIPLQGGVRMLVGLVLFLGVLLSFNVAGWRDRLLGLANPGIDSLAVLPFTNETQDMDADYLCDGLTAELIDRFSRLPQLRVMARTTVFRFKGNESNVVSVGKGLGVKAVLTGQVLERKGALDIRVELVRVSDGSLLWSQHLERNISDIMAVQEDISNEISRNLRLKLSASEKEILGKRYTENVDAYQLYLKGRYYTEQYTKDGFSRAVEQFQEAIRVDPAYARAYTGIADAYYSVSSEFVPPGDALKMMREMTLRALAIDDSLPEAHTLLAMVDAFYNHDLRSAEREFRRGIELSPGSSTAHMWYGDYLNAVGRYSEALTELGKAQRLDPLSPTVQLLIGTTQFFARQYNQAAEQLQSVIQQNPSLWIAHLYLGLVYQQENKRDEARNELYKANLLGGSHRVRAYLAYLDAISGKKADAIKVLRSLEAESKQEYISPFYIAVVYVGLADKDRAFQYLEKAYEGHEEAILFLKVDPTLDPLRSDPRFKTLINRVGLEP